MEKRGASLTPILYQILEYFLEAAREKLDIAGALDLTGAILPLYVFSFEHITRREAQVHIDHISKELSQASIRLERMDKSKSDFISVAAQELKTLITLIEGYASM